MIVSSATITPKGAAKNQDASWIGHTQNYKVMAVADGIGSFEFAELAAQFACQAIAEYTQKNSVQSFDMFEAFTYAQNFLSKKANQYLHQNNIQPVDIDLFGTTLIVAVEIDDEFICGYCGNGGIFHIRGNFDHFQNTQYLPWNAINYLNPHTVQNAQGREALYKFLSPQSTTTEYLPTTLRISKDNQWYGDILVICTDGIFSNDQVQIGKDSKDNIWIQGQKTISILYEYLKPLPLTKERLNQKMHQYLAHLLENKLLDDDATLAISISQTAISYHQKRQHETA
ncbi:MAG: protein phosphatase 2C domain-containing protein [Bacteroidia bacterium]|nr:protein phosphatase 2C domain-containing protein [Bacteroidia bacterium]MDW8301606.1 protein phosphatase 2C domain-containing protein [Bacteroidia bacterium]